MTTVRNYQPGKCEDLLKQESVERAYKSKKEQLDFISIWQKLIDVNGITAKEMLNMVMKTFLNHFDVDRAVYIRYSERGAAGTLQ